jgi:hypothetical protein
MAKLIGYDLDAIEREVRETITDWGGRIEIDRLPGRLDLFEPGILDDAYNECTVYADGPASIHWSLPRGIALDGIVTRHRIVQEDAP